MLKTLYTLNKNEIKKKSTVVKEVRAGLSNLGEELIRNRYNVFNGHILWLQNLSEP